ncbi:acetylglutamate kinase [Salvia divinorum]|uniref:Acetylglutamate kinase n=1 Tax=Salvia divinorum TaxID=28513 RepID=A0ABD1IBM5_SALDI
MPKLLADFLQEQQEPFALEVYLVERGLTFHNSAKYVAPNCSYFVRLAFSRLLMANANGGRRNFLTAKPESTSCSESDASGSHSAIRRFVKCGNCFFDREVDDADTNSKLRAEEEDSKQQLSPVSVLGETDSDQDSPIYYKQCNFETSSSSSQCKLKRLRLYVLQKSREPEPYDKYIINKMALHQIERQELIEKHRKKGENAIFEQQKWEISMEIENDILENVIHEIVITWLDWIYFVA